MNVNLFFVGFDFPDKIPLGKPGSAQTMAANYNDIVSLFRHQMRLDKENKEKKQQEQDDIARLKQEQHKLKQGQQKV